MDVYVCQNDLESILSGIYDAGRSGKRSGDQRLEIAGEREPELFCRYLEVTSERRKAESVQRAVRERLGQNVLELLWDASLCGIEGKADCMYRFLVDGFRHGGKIIHMLSLPSVFQMLEMQRTVRNEAHLLTGFVRFARTRGGVLAGIIGPKNDVLISVADHFEDRLSGENWILVDEVRGKAAVHRAGGRTVMVQDKAGESVKAVRRAGREDPFEELWRTFTETIAIEERGNPRCQRTHLPLRYRKYMTEFQRYSEGQS